jgi:hypothetical protein
MKYDYLGNSQLYVAKFEQGAWSQQRLTSWKYRFNFSGKGSIINEISLKSFINLGNGKMALGFSHVKFGTGEIVFDEKTLLPIGKQKFIPDYPSVLDSVKTIFSKPIIVNKYVNGNFILRRETLAANNDVQPAPPVPANYMLQMIEIGLKGDISRIIENSIEPVTFKVKVLNQKFIISNIEGKHNISIYNISGSMIIHKAIDADIIEFNNLAKGVYFVKVDSQVKKIVI